MEENLLVLIKRYFCKHKFKKIYMFSRVKRYSAPIGSMCTKCDKVVLKKDN